MKKFKIAVTKDQKKYTLVFTSENEITARDRIHNEGYSILNVEEITERIDTGHTFSFVGELKGEHKSGKVMGKDIFKVYLKLRRDLGYKVIELYSSEEANVTQEKKEKQIKNLEEEFDFFILSKKKSNKEQNKKVTSKGNKNTEETNIDSFYMKKELDQTYKFIDFVLVKVKNLIENKEIKDLDLEQKEKFRDVYNSIIKLKKTTNVNKLKEVGELALLKVGLVEQQDLDLHKTKEMRVLLGETNKLLKKIGSTRQFIEKDRDYKRIFSEKFNSFVQSILDIKKGKFGKRAINIDKSSHDYVRTELLIKKYNEKLSENSKDIIKNIFKFLTNEDFRDDMTIRRQVIKQNITLLDIKQRGFNYSYTAIKKGYSRFLTTIETMIREIRLYLFTIIFLYSCIVLLYILGHGFGSAEHNFIGSIRFNYQGLFYFILIIFVYLTLFIRRGFISLGVNFVILFFILIFGVINF
ncbi:MAG: DUF805 domain-containing protein [Candidatus Gracilibacteria bacterium]|nr:DUF805 domain-containing protein [Candidatus Gracilibacteria bacterium]